MLAAVTVFPETSPAAVSQRTDRRARDRHPDRRGGARRAAEGSCPHGHDGHPPGHRRVRDQGQDDPAVPRPGLRRRGERRPHPRPAAQRRRRAGAVQGPAVGAARGRRRQRLPDALRRQPRQEGQGRPAQGAAEGRGRAAARHRRGPRGRGDRLAPARDPQAQGAGPAHGLPRDHPVGDPARGRDPARARPGARRRAGDAARARPALRLRGQPGPVEEGHAAAVRRPRAVRRHPRRRHAGARAHGVPAGRVLGRGGPLRRRRGRDRPHGAAQAHRDAARARRTPPRHRLELRADDGPAQGRRRRRAARRGERPRPRAAPRRARRSASARPTRSPTAASRTPRS